MNKELTLALWSLNDYLALVRGKVLVPQTMESRGDCRSLWWRGQWFALLDRYSSGNHIEGDGVDEAFGACRSEVHAHICCEIWRKETTRKTWL